MKIEAIRAARIDFSDALAPYAVDFCDVYHSRAGALMQARHVFLQGNGLPERWHGRERFVVLETGFGLGNNFLATWDAWRRDPDACRRLHFISVERHPPTREDMARAPRDAALAPLAEQLARTWPPLTPNLHRLTFDDGRVELLLALGDVSAWLPELVAQVDAFYLDGFAPAKNPQMWQPRLFKAMGRLAAPGATAATWTAARAVREGLSAAGFEVRLEAGHGGKRDITLARFAPAFVPRRAPSRIGEASGGRHAVIVGAGLAGCAAAWALAEQGWSSVLVDRHVAPAQEASGNPAGLFHGIVNAQDGTHARFNRAAALEAQRTIGASLARGAVTGSVQGLLRLETSGMGAPAMRAMLSGLGLPQDYVRAVDADEAQALCGLPLGHPAWFYPGGGWVKPGELAQSLLDRAGDAVRLRAGASVHSLRRAGVRWQALDDAGTVIEEGDALVLANAGDAKRLRADAAWPMRSVRGQISLLPAAQAGPLPRVPIAGAGYLLPEVDGRAIFGATAQVGDDEPACRHGDHGHNLAQLATLTGRVISPPPSELQGRVAWRWVCDDRLPIIGAVPDTAAVAQASRLDQPRFVPRAPGLFVFTGLGSRGITWCALGAQVLASAVSGAPSPLEASLLDAVDPGRFITRQRRPEIPPSG